MNAKELDLAEKWILTASLMGLGNVANLWESGDSDTYQTLEYMEELENHASLVKDRDLPMLAAQKAMQMGVTSDMLSKYAEHKQDLKHKAEAARLAKEEAENELLNTLKTQHNFKTKVGSSRRQRYWSFTGDIGDGGVFDYECRVVSIDWSKVRIWREWKDAQGVKHREKRVEARYEFSMDTRWPELWRKTSTTPGYSLLPWVYTEHTIRREIQRKLKQAELDAKAAARRAARLQKKQLTAA